MSSEMSASDTEGAFDPTPLFTPEVATDPIPFFSEMLDKCPVSRTSLDALDGGSSVTITRYDDVRWALRHPEIFSSSADAVQIGQERPMIPLQIDPPDHAKYRRLLDPELAPRWIAELEDETAALVDEIIDTFVDAGSCDYHADFAQPLPSTVFLNLWGLPLEKRPDFYRWRDNIVRPSTLDPEEAQRVRTETGKEMYAYFEEVIDERTAAPDGALFSRLLDAEIEGNQLTREEILDISYLFLIAGLDTVTATLDCATILLLGNPRWRQWLVENPDRTDMAVEEVLRHESPVQVVPRIVKEPVTMAGVDLEPGDVVTLLLGASNVDPRHFEHAEDVDFEREVNRHLAFGGGPHRCLGSHLARMELRVALRGWHERIPDYDLGPDADLTLSPGIRQPTSLPLVWQS